MSAITATPETLRSRRSFGQRLIIATRQYAICVFGTMVIAVAYAIVKRFPELASALGTAVILGLFVLLAAWIYARIKHVFVLPDFASYRRPNAQIGQEHPFRPVLDPILQAGASVLSALQALSNLLFK